MEKIVRQDIPFTQTFVGYVKGAQSVEVHAQVSGILEKRLYKEGAEVKAGQVLFEIDPAVYQAKADQAQGRVNSAKARLENARRDWERAVPLAERNSISQRELDTVQTEYDSARAGLKEAEAALRSARIELDLTRVRSPIPGFVSMALRTEGSLVSAGSSDSLLATVHNMDPVQVIFSVSDSLVRRLKAHLASGSAVMGKAVPATLLIDDQTPYPHQGTLTFGNPVINPETGCMIAKAVFPNPEKELLPGQVVRITLHLMTFRNALSVPQYAVLQSQGESLVAVVDDTDTVEFRPIRVGAVLERDFVVDSGLQGNERIVLEGLNKIGPGMKVAPLTEPAPAASPRPADKG